MFVGDLALRYQHHTTHVGILLNHKSTTGTVPLTTHQVLLTNIKIQIDPIKSTVKIFFCTGELLSASSYCQLCY